RSPAMLRLLPIVLALSVACLILGGDFTTGGQPAEESVLAIKPGRVYDGASARAESGWVVVVRGGKIDQAGPEDRVKLPANAKVMALPDATLLPGLIDAHTHLLLHPYDETKWDDQVLKEPLALRVCRAVNHARATLHAGFTTIRD